MNSIMRHINTFLESQDGVTSVEYAVVLGLILMAIVGAIGSLGSQTGGMWGRICGDLQAIGFIK